MYAQNKCLYQDFFIVGRRISLPFIKNPPPFRRIPTLVYYDHPYFPEELQENLGYTMHSLVFVLTKGDYFSVSNLRGCGIIRTRCFL